MNSGKTSLWPEPFSPEAALYLLATPIGNLRDITLRALDVIEAADVIYCEDTRVFSKLLKAYGVTKKTLKSYHDHSDDRVKSEILKAIQEGKVVALASDAGMPLISDPGYKLVSYIKENGGDVYSIPGANAALCGLQLSCLPSDRFIFHGFMPAKTGERKSLLNAYKSLKATHIFYETAPRLLKSLKDIDDLYDQRECVVAREITKRFEEVKKGTAAELMTYFEENTLKGEIVLLIGGSTQDSSQDIDIEQEIKALIGDYAVKEIAAILHERTGISKKALYDKAVEIKNAD